MPPPSACAGAASAACSGTAVWCYAEIESRRKLLFPECHLNGEATTGGVVVAARTPECGVVAYKYDEP